MTQLIIGLGNPGRQYAHNRHNVGFQCLDYLAKQHSLDFARRQARAVLATGFLAGQKVILAKPQTYMNLSGLSVRELVSFYKIELKDLLVIYDDLDLPVGIIRIRPGGSSGGQKGMRSIIEQLHSEEFPRLRVGIGRPAFEDAAGHVLQDFSPAERKIMKEIYPRVAEAVECLLAEGIEKAMNLYNRNE